jgi:hypothetical protein
MIGNHNFGQNIKKKVLAIVNSTEKKRRGKSGGERNSVQKLFAHAISAPN